MNVIYRSKDEFVAQLSDFTSVDGATGFVAHLAALIAGADFKHSYDVTFKAWKKAFGQQQWRCMNLIDAKDQYWWHGTFEENHQTLNDLSRNLKSSLARESNQDVLYNALRILEWGDVYKGCVSYLLNKYESGQLTSSINDAVTILDGSDYDLNRFDQRDLRMDSGLTKVYSLASERSIIFDSRVAAALSLIAHRFYDKEQRKKLKKLRAFACGSSAGADKKRRTIRDKRVFSALLTPEKQAHFNLTTNWVLNSAVAEAQTMRGDLFKLWGVDNHQDLLRSVEASLFMVGSDITNG
jgi:hypothetical protein